MSISTLDNLVYAAVRAADAGDLFAGNGVADAENINVGGVVPNLSAVEQYTISSPDSFVETNVLTEDWQTQALLPAGYMDDFFTDQSPFVNEQIPLADVPAVPVSASDVPVSNTNPAPFLPKIPTPKIPTAKIPATTKPTPAIPASKLLPTDQVSETDWDVRQIGREISSTLYDSGFEELSRIAFDLADDYSRNADDFSGVKKTDADKSLNLSATDQSPKIVSGLSREFDVVAIRKEFPILSERVHGKPLVWFDNGATTQKPRVVMDRLRYFYEHENSNVHRGAHDLAARSTDAYERSREVVRRFVNAASANEIVFVRGTTEAINLVASAWGKDNIHAGDEIVISYLEHHANIVPWQILASDVGATLRVIPVNANGELLISGYTDILRSGKVKLVAVTQVSNAIGTITPIEEIVNIAHQFGAVVLVDGAQSVPHIPTDVQTLGVDFFVFSGHKIFAPTGIGVLYGKEAILNSMRPYQSGGGMIADVTFERTIYNPAPARFEAGTGNIADAVGLAAALDYVGSIGLESIRQYEHRLLEYALGEFNQIDGVRIIGNAANRAAVISFLVDGFTTDEVNKILAAEGIAVRAGHHCAQPILRRFGLESTVRASLALYNTYEEIDFLVKIIKDIAKKSRR
ncbi:MAG: cysteine desulfurase [Planctomycetaceae bacterium]|jgi:cysteine desulfurase/selenocysteine lyase|nr:cysteine desulfurase [Planctomycetaceae bacterium]